MFYNYTCKSCDHKFHCCASCDADPWRYESFCSATCYYKWASDEIKRLQTRLAVAETSEKRWKRPTMPKYQAVYVVDRASGTQLYEVDAATLDEARQLLEAGEGRCSGEELEPESGNWDWNSLAKLGKDDDE